MKFTVAAIKFAAKLSQRRSSARFFAYAKSWRKSFALWSGGDFYCLQTIRMITANDFATVAVTGAAAAYFRRSARARFGLSDE